MNKNYIIVIALVVVALLFWFMKAPKTTEAPVDTAKAPETSTSLANEVDMVDVGGSIDTDLQTIDADAAAL